MPAPAARPQAERDFLKSHLQAYVDAGPKKTEFYVKLLSEFWKKFPVRDALRDEGRLSPDLSVEEANAIIKDELDKREKYIQNWYNNNKKKTISKDQPVTKELKDRSRRILQQRLVASLKNHRSYHPEEMYDSMYAEKVTQQVAVFGALSGKADRMSIRRQARKTCWENETDEVKAKVLEEVAKQKAELKGTIKMARQETFQNMSPTELVVLINEIRQVLFDLCRDMYNITGWTLICIAGGPNPHDTNEVQLITASATMDDSRLTFPMAEVNLWSDVSQRLGKWLAKNTKTLSAAPMPVDIQSDEAQPKTDIGLAISTPAQTAAMPVDIQSDEVQPGTEIGLATSTPTQTAAIHQPLSMLPSQAPELLFTPPLLQLQSVESSMDFPLLPGLVATMPATAPGSTFPQPGVYRVHPKTADKAPYTPVLQHQSKTPSIPAVLRTPLSARVAAVRQILDDAVAFTPPRPAAPTAQDVNPLSHFNSDYLSTPSKRPPASVLPALSVPDFPHCCPSPKPLKKPTKTSEYLSDNGTRGRGHGCGCGRGRGRGYGRGKEHGHGLGLGRSNDQGKSIVDDTDHSDSASDGSAEEALSDLRELLGPHSCPHPCPHPSPIPAPAAPASTADNSDGGQAKRLRLPPKHVDGRMLRKRRLQQRRLQFFSREHNIQALLNHLRS